MANTTLFRSLVGALIPRADTRNEAGGPAYTLPPQQALAQYAATGCLNITFYASAESQLDRVLDLCGRVTPEFVAKTAVYCRERGHMKDMPALLLASVSRRDPKLMDRVFDRVVDDCTDAPNVRASGPLGRDGSQVARLGAKTVRAPLARSANRRGSVSARRSGMRRPSWTWSRWCIRNRARATVRGCMATCWDARLSARRCRLLCSSSRPSRRATA